MLFELFGSQAESKTYALMDYIGAAGDVADPYGQDLAHYKSCAKMLEDALKKKRMRGYGGSRVDYELTRLAPEHIRRAYRA